MSTSVNIASTNSTVSVEDVNKQITVVDNSQGTRVDIAQSTTSTIQVLTGLKGDKGDTGPVGPSGSAGTVDTGSLVTTASFNSFTSSFNTGSFNGSFTGSLLGSSLNVIGSTDIKAVQETIVLATSTTSPSMSFDFNSGSIFYLTNQSNTTIWNIINLPTTSQKSTTLTFVIEQGVTAYSASAYQFNGSSISVKWPQGVVPTGSANTTDAIGLTAFRSGSTWNVLGSLTPFI